MNILQYAHKKTWSDGQGGKLVELRVGRNINNNQLARLTEGQEDNIYTEDCI